MKLGKWRNEEMETHVSTEPWILAEIMEMDRQSWQDGLLLVVWPARLLSWLMTGISNHLLERSIECNVSW